MLPAHLSVREFLEREKNDILRQICAFQKKLDDVSAALGALEHTNKEQDNE